MFDECFEKNNRKNEIKKCKLEGLIKTDCLNRNSFFIRTNCKPTFMKHILRILYTTAILHLALFATAQVTKLANNNNIQFGSPVGSKVLMVSKDSLLWSTDGTTANTKNYATNVKVDYNHGLAILSNKVYFPGRNSANGNELWVTDGTATGTKLVKDIFAGTKSSSPTDFFVFNNTLYFFAKTSTNGIELWKSNGTATGTIMVKNINAGSADSYSNFANFFANNNILYFVANDGAHGTELWKTNGTASGTVMVKDINVGKGSSNVLGLTAFGTQVIFSASDSVHGQELWITNGTSTGTKMVKDIESTIPTFGSNPSGFYLFNGKLYFSALTFANGLELWVTDGTTTGTKMVKDINAGNASSSPFTFDAITIGSKFYFQATTNSQGAELWSSDGTSTNTKLLKDIRAGSASSDPFIDIDFFTGRDNLFNGKIFLMANNGTNGNELWITNGTATGTTMVKDINPGTKSSVSSNNLSYFYTNLGLYFPATNGTNGVEFWLSNGTSTGTKMIKDINVGADSSSPSVITFFNHHLLFTADDGDNAARKTDLFLLNVTLDTLPSVAIAATTTDVNVAPDGTTFSIYPNPATDHLIVTVTSVSDKKAWLTVTNQQGKQLHTQELNRIKGIIQYSVNIKTLPPGMYYLQLTTSSGMKSVKFIKN